jgi:hypothetical protein
MMGPTGAIGREVRERPGPSPCAAAHWQRTGSRDLRRDGPGPAGAGAAGLEPGRLAVASGRSRSAAFITLRLPVERALGTVGPLGPLSGTASGNMTVPVDGSGEADVRLPEGHDSDTDFSAVVCTGTIATVTGKLGMAQPHLANETGVDWQSGYTSSLSDGPPSRCCHSPVGNIATLSGTCHLCMHLATTSGSG